VCQEVPQRIYILSVTLRGFLRIIIVTNTRNNE
jgi:hypothetical protein